MISKNTKGNKNIKEAIFKKFTKKQDGFSHWLELAALIMVTIFFCTYLFEWDWSVIFAKIPTALGSMFDKVLNMWK